MAFALALAVELLALREGARVGAEEAEPELERERGAERVAEGEESTAGLDTEGKPEPVAVVLRVGEASLDAYIEGESLETVAVPDGVVSTAVGKLEAEAVEAVEGVGVAM